MRRFGACTLNILLNVKWISLTYSSSHMSGPCHDDLQRKFAKSREGVNSLPHPGSSNHPHTSMQATYAMPDIDPVWEVMRLCQDCGAVVAPV